MRDATDFMDLLKNRLSPQQVGVLAERQLRLIQERRGRTADPEQHVEAAYSGYLLCHD
jgi:hypothetical protein